MICPFMCRLSQCPQGRMCRHVHTCTCHASAYASISHAEKLVNFHKLNLHLNTFGFRWVFWDATGGLPFEVLQTWKRCINHNLNSMEVSSFSLAWNFKCGKILKTSKEKSSCLPDRKTHFAEFCTHLTNFSPSIDQYLRYFCQDNF